MFWVPVGMAGKGAKLHSLAQPGGEDLVVLANIVGVLDELLVEGLAGCALLGCPLLAADLLALPQLLQLLLLCLTPLVLHIASSHDEQPSHYEVL